MAVGAVGQGGSPEVAALPAGLGGEGHPDRRGVDRLAQGGHRLRVGVGLDGLAGQEYRHLGVCRQLVLALGRQGLDTIGPPSAHRLVAGHQGHHTHPDGHHRHHQAGCDQGALAPCGGPPAGQHVLALDGGGGRLGLGGGTGQPALRRLQFAAPQKEAAVAVLGVPLEGLDQPAGVLLAGGQVGVEGPDHPVEGGVDVLGLGEGDPVTVADLLGDGRVGHRRPQRGDDALLEAAGVGDLLLAEVGGHRVGGDHEQEGVGPLDGRPQGLREDLGVGDALGVDPHRLAPLLQRGGHPLDEIGVPP